MGARRPVVLLDAGGVLVEPDFARHADLTGGRFSRREVRSRFFELYGKTSIPTQASHGTFDELYAQEIGIEPKDLVGRLDWNVPISGSVEAVRRLRASGGFIAVVSNAGGDLRELLTRAGYRPNDFDLVLDSGDQSVFEDEVKARKPSPLMLEMAIDAAGLDIDEPGARTRVRFVGDAMWSDGLAAKALDVPWVHLTEATCTGLILPGSNTRVLPPSEHDHAVSLADALPLLLGSRSMHSAHVREQEFRQRSGR